jgi:hypothetical protein
MTMTLAISTEELLLSGLQPCDHQTSDEVSAAVRASILAHTSSGETSAAPVVDRLRAAAGRVYDAEFALHHARQSHVDAWVTAAADKLHLAVGEYLAVVADTQSTISQCQQPAAAVPPQLSRLPEQLPPATSPS